MYFLCNLGQGSIDHLTLEASALHESNGANCIGAADIFSLSAGNWDCY